MKENINKIIHGDCLVELKTLEENSIDSIVCDPPYELGFMGKSWDNTGIANNKEMWAECLRILKPGGHLLAFSGTRTYHRMASAIEDAGFEVRDMIEWVYGSGFPKSLNIGKAIDKINGVEVEQLPTLPMQEATEVGSISKNRRCAICLKAISSGNPCQCDRTYKAQNEFNGWGTALKPAHEPICMARKPLAENTVAENCLKYGTGGINIDESRVAHQSEADRLSATPQGKVIRNNFAPGEDIEGTETNRPDTSLGRFPANLIHDNSEEVRECFPDAKGSKGSGLTQTPARSWKNTSIAGINRVGYEDNGNASRFFKSIIYQAKASKSERNRGCEGLEDIIDRPFEERLLAQCKVCGNKGLKVGAGKQLTCGHTKIEYVKTEYKPSSNNHPTVKPIALMEYLIKMVTPKGGIVLDPFAGSGTTLVAAKQNGYQYIGIEMTEEYIPIIEARLK